MLLWGKFLNFYKIQYLQIASFIVKLKQGNLQKNKINFLLFFKMLKDFLISLKSQNKLFV